MTKWIVSLFMICLVSVPAFSAQRKILIMVPDDFMWPEYELPRAAYEKAGFTVFVAAKSKDVVTPDRRNKAEYPDSHPVKPDFTFDELKLPLVDQYEALTFVGGNGAWHDFFPTTRVHEILASSLREKKMIVGLLCASTGLLGVAANYDGRSKPVAEGRKVVGYYKVEGLLRDLGKVKFVAGKNDEVTVVRDDNLVTGRNPQSSQKFGEEIVAALSKGK